MLNHLGLAPLCPTLTAAIGLPAASVPSVGKPRGGWYDGARGIWCSADASPLIRPAVELIRELEQRGAKVLVFQADAADRERMRFVLAEVRRQFPPLRGIVHAAGAIRDAVLLKPVLA